MTKKEFALDLRSNPDIHYNCAQTVLASFMEETGLSFDQSAAVAAHFGSGMRIGATCGALTGALMALGLMGAGEEAATALTADFLNREGATACTELLDLGEKQGIEKPTYCEGLILHCIELVEQYGLKR